MSQKTPQQPPSRWDLLKSIFGRRPPRTETMMSRLHYEAGLIPILNEDDTEARRQEIKDLLIEIRMDLFDESKQKEVVSKVYALFFYAGDIWYRGLDNRELAEKVVCFLENFKDVGHLDSFVPDLHEEAMQLLSLSFQAGDVTNTPAVFIDTKPIVAPEWTQRGGGQPATALDMTGYMELNQEVQRLRGELEKYQKGQA